MAKNELGMGKLILGVSLGIIFVPILLCGGCLFFGAVGTTATVATVGATAAAIEAENQKQEASEATRRQAENTKRVSERDREIETRLSNAKANHERIQAEIEKQLAAKKKAETDRLAAIEELKELEGKQIEFPEFEPRTWQTFDEKFRVEATLVNTSKTGDQVQIRRADGKLATLPTERLIAEDRVYIGKQTNVINTAKAAKLELAAEKLRLNDRIVSLENIIVSPTPELPPEPTRETILEEVLFDEELIAAAKVKEAQEKLEKAREAAENMPQMTMRNFLRCETGMTYDQVVAIVGQPSQLMSENEIAGFKTSMFVWKAGIVANANMTFQDGKLASKAQFGL